ncbi:PA0069 family radical SAM protein [Rubinisphaera brasiliensis]|uniref:Radical SAM domain protein n=1 Tax=Rubinisphaera brasiliensis (strain ATCC 49424 / DSM 5305 / JCM 21570 / IAM 15109 / NBRC 103401 / IFAM 1448) TaxID=756272 RepID=F0SIA7_RUBBR|nr:PA0069 family radical SAM protein [Rubinisphaera brasiliensis]ADY58496.1 Radical SAM domain protein [Rubinisphaera brasiliensis DSM 5305]
MVRHGSQIDPPNRFEKVHVVPDWEQLEWDVEYQQERADRPVQYLADASRSIVSENDSPDVPFRYSINPYRGCAHACPYCYARNTHEYLGMNAGLDFETRIFVKQEAAKLFREFLARDAWQPEPIIFSGVTDCYQPAERDFRLTRQCLEVAWECRQPVSIITKNALVLRDLDLLRNMASCGLVHVNVSITSLNAELVRQMEPRASIPAARLRAVQTLSQAGIPTRVMVAPIVPGLTDHEAPQILQAAREAGATDARYVLLRLPQTVEPVFREWLERNRPAEVTRVEGRIQHARGGEFNQSGWHTRMRGQGEIAERIGNLFEIWRRKLGFENLQELTTDQFRPPRIGQLKLF